MISRRKVGQRGPMNETRGYIINILATGQKNIKEITSILRKEIGIHEERTIRSHLSALISEGIIHSDANEKDKYHRTRSQSKKPLHYTLSFNEVNRVPRTFRYMYELGGKTFREFMISPWYRQFAVLYSLKFSDAAKFIMTEEFYPDMNIDQVIKVDHQLENEYDEVKVSPDLLIEFLAQLAEKSSDFDESILLKKRMPEFKRTINNLEKTLVEEKKIDEKIRSSWEKSSEQALGSSLLMGFRRNPPVDVVANLIKLTNEDQRGSVLSKAILTFPDSANAFFDWMLTEKPDDNEVKGECDAILCHLVKILRTKKKAIHDSALDKLAKGMPDKSTEANIVGGSHYAITEVMALVLTSIDFTDSVFQLGMLGNYLTSGSNDKYLKRSFVEMINHNNQL